MSVNLQKTESNNQIFIPRLENGDRLDQKEFHRRCKAMPKNVKAELSKGIVYMALPVRVKNHGKPHSNLMSCLGLYRLSTDGGYIACENYESQPDITLRIEEGFSGKSWVNEDDYPEGSSELVIEIAASSVSFDLHDKLEMDDKKVCRNMSSGGFWITR